MAVEFTGSKAHVDLLKGYAIVAVVSIHFISAFINRFTPGSFAWQTMVAADQITRFCVPMFVALSGFALARKYSSAPPGFFQFLTARAVKILPPYLVWSLVYYLAGILVPSLTGYSRSAPVWELAIFGRTQYHLYFVPMIFQLYLLFPLILRLVKKFGFPLVVVSYLIQIFLYLRTGAPGWSDQTQYFWFYSWISYFFLGTYLGTVDLSGYFSSKLAALTAFLITSVGLVWTVVDGFILLNQGKNLILATSFTRLPVLLFATGAYLISFFVIKPNFFTRLGAWSYQIYLGHVLVLQVLSLFV